MPEQILYKPFQTVGMLPCGDFFAQSPLFFYGLA